MAALAQTARVFYYTWRPNPTSICRAVAPRVILTLEDAERLLGMQEEADPTAGPVSQTQDGHLQKSIIRAKRPQFNASCTLAASNVWAKACRDLKWYDMYNGHLQPSELARFEHAFYCIWTIGVMGNTPHLQDQASAFLDESSPRELYGLSKVAHWAKLYHGTDFGVLGFDVRDCAVWETGCNLVTRHWDAYVWEACEADDSQISILPHAILCLLLS